MSSKNSKGLPRMMKVSPTVTDPSMRNSLSDNKVSADELLKEMNVDTEETEQVRETLFNTKPNNLHNSLNDILVTLRCFIKMRNNVDLLETCEDYNVMATNLALF